MEDPLTQRHSEAFSYHCHTSAAMQKLDIKNMFDIQRLHSVCTESAQRLVCTASAQSLDLKVRPGSTFV